MLLSQNKEINMKQITLGWFREVTKDMKDDTTISFLFREDLLNDDGKDYYYIPTSIWTTLSEVTLVGITPPECEEDLEIGEINTSVN